MNLWLELKLDYMFPHLIKLSLCPTDYEKLERDQIIKIFYRSSSYISGVQTDDSQCLSRRLTAIYPCPSVIFFSQFDATIVVSTTRHTTPSSPATTATNVQDVNTLAFTSRQRSHAPSQNHRNSNYSFNMLRLKYTMRPPIDSVVMLRDHKPTIMKAVALASSFHQFYLSGLSHALPFCHEFRISIYSL